jgi:hypothetical protein
MAIPVGWGELCACLLHGSARVGDAEGPVCLNAMARLTGILPWGQWVLVGHHP